MNDDNVQFASSSAVMLLNKSFVFPLRRKLFLFLLWPPRVFKPPGGNTYYAWETLQVWLKPDSCLIHVPPYLSAGASVSANTTPVASHVTAAAQASTRSHGVPQRSTAPMNASVSVLAWLGLMQHTRRAPLVNSKRRLAPPPQPFLPSPFTDALIWCCGNIPHVTCVMRNTAPVAGSVLSKSAGQPAVPAPAGC